MIFELAERMPTPIDEAVARHLARSGGDPEAAIRAWTRRQCRDGTLVGGGLGLPGGLPGAALLPAGVAHGLYRNLRQVLGVARLRGYPLHEPEVRALACRAANVPARFAEEDFSGEVGEVVQMMAREGARKGSLRVFRQVLRMSPRLVRLIGVEAGRRAPASLVSRAGSLVPIVGGALGGVMAWREIKRCGEEACRLFPPRAAISGPATGDVEGS